MKYKDWRAKQLEDPQFIEGYILLLETENFKLIAQLEQAKVAIEELAEPSNYSISAYSEVQWDGSDICKHPWNYATRVLAELEAEPA